MTFGIFSYLITILIFAGTAVLIEWTLGYKKLKEHTKVIFFVTVLGLIATLIGESAALNWRIWLYSQDKIFGIYFGAALETFIYTIFVVIAVSSATLIWSDFEDSGKSPLKTTIEEVQDKFRKWFRTQSK